MDNINTSGGNGKNPTVILNADNTQTGKLKIRDGQTKVVSLTDPHSLWACKDVMFCVSQGVLYKIVQGAAVAVGNVFGPKSRMYYAEADGKVYLSNRYWNGAYNISTGVLGPWGVSLPEQPVLSVGFGSLPEGTYHVTFTVTENGEISGNGPIASIELSNGEGISISNVPPGGTVWVTDPNGAIFQNAGSRSNIAALLSVEPLPTFMCSPPPFMENLCYAFGRIWGSVGGDLFYTEPHMPGLVNLNQNVFQFDQTVTMICKVPTGLFVGMDNKTVFLAGTDPKDMRQMDAGAGAVRNTLSYCNNLRELGDILGTNEKVHVDVPVWLSQEGIVAGNASGRLFNLTNNKVRMAPPTAGAGMYRDKNGMFQYLVSFARGQGGSALRNNCLKASQAFADGRITNIKTNSATATNWTKLDMDSDDVGFSEEVIAEVYRGGEPI